MKKSIKPILISLLLLGFMAVAHTNHAQAPPPPPADKGTNNNKAPGGGGGAPIDGGLILSLAMVAGFGAWKLFNVLRKASS
jgi:hypothetical protein